MKGNILVVDDNKSILSTLDILLSPCFESVTLISNPNLIPSELRKKNINLVVLDMNFRAGSNNGNEGLYWLGRIREEVPDISVVMITAYGDVETAVRALKAGASDFILKPWDNDKLLATVRLALQLNLSKEEVKHLKVRESDLVRELNREHKYIIGTSPKLMNVLSIVRKVASTNANVLITGENGTGKELIAKEIHRLSERSADILVSVDMGTLPENLFESELFGHTRGAFTDAHENRPGKFETAHKGTLFLDEIGNLPVHLQSKLLTALESRTIVRIGSNKQVPVDIRLICATNRNIEKMISEGLFRQDLLYRINTIHIEVPPLRERGNDINILADFFLKQFSYKYNKPGLKINQQAQEKLLKYTWPGNVRELQHAVERAVILSEKNIITTEDFLINSQNNLEPFSPDMTLEEMESMLIRQALERNDGNFSAAANQLGITRQTLYNRLKKNKPC